MQLAAVVPTTPPPTPAFQPPVAQPAPAAPPAETHASFSQLLLGKLGGAQQQAVQSQQLLGAISSTLTQRVSLIGHSVWAALRGTAAPTDTSV